MTICEHCGASVTGSVCEYCDMPVKNIKPAPPKIIYKSDKSESTLSLPVIKHRKKFFRTIGFGCMLLGAVCLIISSVLSNQHSNMVYIQSPAEYAIEYNGYNDDSYLLEEVIPVYDEERPVYDANEILQENGAFPSGTYQIGVDIPEGLYIFIPDFADGHGVEGVYSDPDCQNQISSAYVHFDGSRIAEISGRGYLDFAWATAYNLDMHPEIVNDPYETDGMFIVGRDIPAGTYTLTGYGEYVDCAEWYIYSSINAISAVLKEFGQLEYGDYMENITNEIIVNDGELLELRNCIIKYIIE